MRSRVRTRGKSCKTFPQVGFHQIRFRVHQKCKPRHKAPPRLRIQHEVVAGPRDDPRETFIIRLRQSATIGGRRSTAPRLQF
jgi:hypothetical protein